MHTSYGPTELLEQDKVGSGDTTLTRESRRRLQMQSTVIADISRIRDFHLNSLIQMAQFVTLLITYTGSLQ